MMVWQQRGGSWLGWIWVGPNTTAIGQMEVCAIMYKARTVLRYVIKSVLVYCILCVCVFVELVTVSVCLGEDFYQGSAGGSLLWQSFLLEEIGLDGSCRGHVSLGKPPAPIISHSFQTKLEENCWFSALVPLIPHWDGVSAIHGNAFFKDYLTETIKATGNMRGNTLQ